MNLESLQHFAANHQGVLTLFGFAAVVNMRKPKNPNSLYAWLYGTLQSFISAIKPHAPDPPEAHIITSQQDASGASLKSDATFPVDPTPIKG